jgi:glycogen synthase
MHFLWFFEYKIKHYDYCDAGIYIKIIEIEKILSAVKKIFTIALAAFRYAFPAASLQVIYLKPDIYAAYLISGNLMSL